MAPANTSPDAPRNSVRSRSKKAAAPDEGPEAGAGVGEEEVTGSGYVADENGLGKTGKTRMGDPGLSTWECPPVGEPDGGLPFEWNMGGVRTAICL
jgi:hypothetical protein